MKDESESRCGASLTKSKTRARTTFETHLTTPTRSRYRPPMAVGPKACVRPRPGTLGLCSNHFIINLNIYRCRTCYTSPSGTSVSRNVHRQMRINQCAHHTRIQRTRLDGVPLRQRSSSAPERKRRNKNTKRRCKTKAKKRKKIKRRKQRGRTRANAAPR